MVPNDFVRAFLFNDADILPGDGKISVPMAMDAGKEGWVGLPHGGIGMGAIVELATFFDHCTGQNDLRYPVHCRFRMGGSEVKVGDTVRVEAVPTATGISGRISAPGAKMPYITGEIEFGRDNLGTDEYQRDYVPDNFSQLSGNLAHIPYYRNCFVCGVERSMPGLKRQFHLWQTPRDGIACAFAGFNSEDEKTIHLFSRNGCLHPLPLFAVLDETMGWGGFMAYGHGGVSVRLQYTVLRKIGVHEKVVFFGRGEQVKGHIDKRLFFWASGCGAVMRDDGTFETVVVSSGQWYGIKALTEQMKNELIPKEQNEKIFSMAGVPWP
ncbi:MAG: hypothetical protein AB1724_02355 [Thermodesulfobacteriota bacterium]